MLFLEVPLRTMQHVVCDGAHYHLLIDLICF